MVTLTYPVLGDSLIDAGSEWRSRHDDNGRRREERLKLLTELPVERIREDEVYLED